MSRRRYLIAYDITDPQRLRRVIAVMEGYGQRLQYSVFLCDLNGRELVTWERDILAAISLAQDSVVTLDLGPQESAVPVRSIGKARTFPSRGPMIV